MDSVTPIAFETVDASQLDEGSRISWDALRSIGLAALVDMRLALAERGLELAATDGALVVVRRLRFNMIRSGRRGAAESSVLLVKCVRSPD